jgi:hypothetical protein
VPCCELATCDEARIVGEFCVCCEKGDSDFFLSGCAVSDWNNCCAVFIITCILFAVSDFGAGKGARSGGEGVLYSYT